MRTKPRAGLLPLYLKLYDDVAPGRRNEFIPFLEIIRAELAAHGIDVLTAPVCRVAPEFSDAVTQFQKSGANCIVTVHLAYSPSLEAADALAVSQLPIIILDTTMDVAFGQDVAPDRITYNHGIHGVMDLASVLRRKDCRFAIVAGHYLNSTVIRDTADLVRAAVAAKRFHHTRAVRVGPEFPGMGDFSVDSQDLRQELEIDVRQVSVDDLIPYAQKVSEEMVEAEVRADRELYRCDLPEGVHRYSVRVGLVLREFLREGGYDAFSMNFLAFDRDDDPVCTVPFLEASKAMARGIGYAGEGDVLTAALVGALAGVFEGTTFTEIFCPDWAGNTLFLSHMGEVNPEISAETPFLIEKDFPYTRARNPAVLTCGFRRGPAVFVNLSPGPSHRFNLIVAPVDVLSDTRVEAMRRLVRAWIRPRRPIADFLEQYSRHGGTHHSALLPGDRTRAILEFGRFAGIETVLID
ncbi:MAG: hypothetical protein N2255_04195 [Kiritimatiellae bacterium]|nr:hypothetical protein [Kiritimatiellia bacterium]